MVKMRLDSVPCGWEVASRVSVLHQNEAKQNAIAEDECSV